MLAALALALASLATWTDRTALDSRAYGDAVAPLIDDERIVVAVSDFAAAEVARRPELEAQLRRALPDRADALSGALEGGLAAAVRRAVPRVMRTERFGRIWREANRATHAEALIILRGDDATGEGTLTLDLRPAVASVLMEIGLSPDLAADLPADIGLAEVGAERDVARARNAVRLLEASAAIVPFVALALLVAGLAIAGRGARMRAVAWAGLLAAVAAGVTLVGLELARDPVIRALATPSAADAGAAVWDVVLRDLVLRSWVIVGVGLIVAAAGFFLARLRGPRQGAF